MEQALLQMERQSTVRNTLVVIENAARDKYRLITDSRVDQERIDALKEQRKALRAEMKNRRKTARSKKAPVADLQADLVTAQAELNKSIALAVAAKKENRELYRQEIIMAEEERRAAVKQAFIGSGLYWCNTDKLVADYETNRVEAMKNNTRLRQHGKKYKDASGEWNGVFNYDEEADGIVTVRYQYGLTVAKAFSCEDTRFQIVPYSAERNYAIDFEAVRKEKQRRHAENITEKGAPRGDHRQLMRMRVGSIGTAKKPQWLELNGTLHRPLPENGIIRSVNVKREKIIHGGLPPGPRPQFFGDKYRWKVLITVVIPGPEKVAVNPRNAVGIDIGWRIVPEGLRVGYYMNTAGQSGQIVISKFDFILFRKLDGLHKVIKDNVNKMIEQLSDWLKTAKLPESVVEAGTFKSIDLWKSPRRLDHVLQNMRTWKRPEDKEIWEQLTAWQKQHYHLRDWLTNLRDQQLRKRREQYRIFAKNIAATYSTVYMKKIDLRTVAETPQAEKDTEYRTMSKRYRFIASVSELRGAVFNACRREGRNFIEVESSPQCKQCSNRIGPEEVICETCGTKFDRDECDALGILRDGLLINETKERSIPANMGA